MTGHARVPLMWHVGQFDAETALMNDETVIQSWADIEYDIAGRARAAQQLAEFESRVKQVVPTRGTRGFEKRARTRGGAPWRGRALLERCSHMTQLRYETLLYHEETFPAAQDHAILIAYASQILESELDRVLAMPALRIADGLIEALSKEKKDRSQAANLERWAEGRSPTMIGTISLLLLALRRGCEHEVESVLEFLDSRFAPPYRALLTSKQLGRCLDTVRNEFRNPACHGTKTFSREPYTEFVRRVIANERFGTWDAQGPNPRPPGPDLGILHHHLEHTRLFTNAGAGHPTIIAEKPQSSENTDPLSRLFALHPSPSSRFGLTLRVNSARSQVRTRDVSVRPTHIPARFRLGEVIRLAIEADRSCHVVVIDVGTLGRVSVLWPNAWHCDGWIEAGRPYYLPDIETPEFSYELTGQIGHERILAIGTLEPIDEIQLRPDSGAAFRVLGLGDVRRLVERLSSDAEGWAVALIEFEVESSLGIGS
jgi:hypothetical protein